MEKYTYTVNVVCKNCAWKGTQEIEKGCSVETLSIRECPVCGCEGLYSLGYQIVLGEVIKGVKLKLKKKGENL